MRRRWASGCSPTTAACVSTRSAERRADKSGQVTVPSPRSGDHSLRRGDESGAPTVEEAVPLRCLTGGEALELLRPQLQDEVTTMRWSPSTAPRVIVLRTTPAKMQRAKALLAEHEGAGAGTCAAQSPTP